MSRDDNDVPDNVIDFPRIGFDLAPLRTSPAGPDPAPGGAPDGAAVGGGSWQDAADQTDTLVMPAADRRSPLDTLSAIPEPGLHDSVITLNEGGLPGPEHGAIPDTFRSDLEPHPHGPQLGILVVAATLAVAVAALRGVHSAVTAWRANREQRQAVARVAAQTSGTGTKTSGKTPKIPSGHDYASKILGRTNKSGSRAGTSSGQQRRGGKSSSSHTGSGKGRDKSASKGSGVSASERRRSKTGGAGLLHRTSQRGTGATRGPKNRKDKDGPAGSPRGRGGRVKAPRGTKGPKGLLRGRKSPQPPKGSRTDVSGKWGKTDRRSAPGGGKNGATKRKGTGRTTLSDAIYKEAARRMKRRRKTTTPPVWGARKDKTKTGPAGTPGGTGTKDKAKARPFGGYWGKTQARARAYWTKHHGRGTTGTAGAGTTGPTPGADGYAGFSGFPGSGGARSTPWGAAGMASETPAGADYTITLERTDTAPGQAHEWHPAGITAGAAALPAAPTPHTQRPGTSRPQAAPARATRLSKEPRMHRPAGTPATPMDAQHETEVTLDDALDLLEQLTADSFTTHDECARLAGKAGELAARLHNLAVDLAVHNNVIGVLTGSSMARLSESMEVIARKADEMQVTSLQAAEKSEAADNALNDAYRPITQATADAGLTVPSARAHNET